MPLRSRSIPHSVFLTFRDRALPEAFFRRLIRRVRQVGGERLGHTYQTTFWFKLEAPRSIVEEAILLVRPWIPESRRRIRGVEWWLSRMSPTNVRVDFHRDRDEWLAQRKRIEIHPVFSSVLFLNRVRGGTLAVTVQPPVTTHPSCAPSRIDFDLAAPRPNRFVCFDGSLTHGVLDANNRIPFKRLREPARLRSAIIINWWHRRPEQVPQFSEVSFYRPLAIRRQRD